MLELPRSKNFVNYECVYTPILKWTTNLHINKKGGAFNVRWSKTFTAFKSTVHTNLKQ